MVRPTILCCYAYQRVTHHDCVVFVFGRTATIRWWIRWWPSRQTSTSVAPGQPAAKVLLDLMGRQQFRSLSELPSSFFCPYSTCPTPKWPSHCVLRDVKFFHKLNDNSHLRQKHVFQRSYRRPLAHAAIQRLINRGVISVIIIIISLPVVKIPRANFKKLNSNVGMTMSSGSSSAEANFRVPVLKPNWIVE